MIEVHAHKGAVAGSAQAAVINITSLAAHWCCHCLVMMKEMIDNHAEVVAVIGSAQPAVIESQPKP